MNQTLAFRLAIICAILGVALSVFAFFMSYVYGQMWLVDNPLKEWRLNNYIVIPSWTAYAFAGVLSLWLGGLFLGVLVALAVKRRLKGAKRAVSVGLPAVVFTGLGFNTMDYMCGWVYWNDGRAGLKTLDLLGYAFTVDPWNFYFAFIIAPLWGGGFLVGYGLAWLILHYIHKT